jgi:hypothetical protein
MINIMKTRIAKLLLLLTLPLFFLNGTCDGDESIDPISMVENNTTGFLCTIGVVRDGGNDTVAYYHSTSGGNFQEYGKEYFLDRDKVIFESQGSNTDIYEIKFVEPYKIAGGDGYLLRTSDELVQDKNAYPADVKYAMDVEIQSLPETKFKIVYDEKGHFTIESQAHPGFYLAAVKWNYATYPTTTHLVFRSSPKEFFFM